jgi:hypothetical protein
MITYRGVRYEHQETKITTTSNRDRGALDDKNIPKNNAIDHCLSRNERK